MTLLVESDVDFQTLSQPFDAVLTRATNECGEECATWWCAQDPAHPRFALIHHAGEQEPLRLGYTLADDELFAAARRWVRSFHS